ncbi:hypothetical protein N8H74_21655 [Pseudomonas sp. B2M1-30]|uniref:hypothetical protein n=1 Tax=Pseudomonas TaxID=286 RepID=UPI0021C77AF4|nr:MULTISPECIES: hypothetical protein [Pseudomonas]MCU0120876.1 hypothetical protein [Pseudomonas sp. B2M1-30]MCU7259935.1 hypothetical protein [Pseudomonas koreensis]
MKKILAILVASFFLLPAVAFSGWFDKHEQLSLTTRLSDTSTIPDDAYLKIIIVGAKPAILEICKDSFAHAFARNVIGNNSNTLIVLTYDSVPILRLQYDEKTRTCTKAYILEKDLSGYTLSTDIARQHKFNIIYAHDAEVNNLSNTLKNGIPLLEMTTSVGPLMSSPITQQAITYFSNAFSNAGTTRSDYTGEFKLPNRENQTKLTLDATIGVQKFVLMELYIEVKKSLFEEKNYQSVMNSKLDNTASIQEILNARRTKEGINFKSGDYSIIKSECSYLKNSFQSKLNSMDLQRLQEAYLLNNHRDKKMGIGSLEQCFGYPIRKPNEQLTFKFLVDEVSSAAPDIDTHFLKFLTTGEHAKILTKDVNFHDQDTDLDISSMAKYLKLKKSTPLCHSYIGYHQVAFMQIINNKNYFLTASINQEYSKLEASKGKLSKISNLSISRTPDPDYENIGEVAGCISNWSQIHQSVSSR